MKRNLLVASLLLGSFAATAQQFERDVFTTAGGDLAITFIGHGSLMFEFDGKIIHIDPSSREADYSTLPKADLVLITHHHGDHCDPKAFTSVKKANTTTVLTKLSHEKLNEGSVLANGEKTTYGRVMIEALPAYNLVSCHTLNDG